MVWGWLLLLSRFILGGFIDIFHFSFLEIYYWRNMSHWNPAHHHISLECLASSATSASVLSTYVLVVMRTDHTLHTASRASCHMAQHGRLRGNYKEMWLAPLVQVPDQPPLFLHTRPLTPKSLASVPPRPPPPWPLWDCANQLISSRTEVWYQCGSNVEGRELGKEGAPNHS